MRRTTIDIATRVFVLGGALAGWVALAVAVALILGGER
jgi:hypothetical protein